MTTSRVTIVFEFDETHITEQEVTDRLDALLEQNFKLEKDEWSARGAVIFADSTFPPTRQRFVKWSN